MFTSPSSHTYTHIHTQSTVQQQHHHCSGPPSMLPVLSLNCSMPYPQTTVSALHTMYWVDCSISLGLLTNGFTALAQYAVKNHTEIEQMVTFLYLPLVELLLNDNKTWCSMAQTW